MRTPEGVSLPRASFSALTVGTSLKACSKVPWRVWSCLGEALETRKLHSNLHHLEMRRAAGFAKLLPRGSISIWVHSESDTTERLPFHFSLSCIGKGNGNPIQCPCLENPRDGGAWWAAVYGVTELESYSMEFFQTSFFD